MAEVKKWGRVGGCKTETELSLNLTKSESRTEHSVTAAMVHILGVHLFEANFVKVCFSMWSLLCLAHSFIFFSMD